MGSYIGLSFGKLFIFTENKSPWKEEVCKLYQTMRLYGDNACQWADSLRVSLYA
jgi:hypothetical protein